MPDSRPYICNQADKSSQVKSSSNFNGGRARRLWGARRRERSGGRGAAQLAWLDSPEPGLYPHRLLLDHRGAPSHQLRAFFRKSTVWQCNTAPGRRWERSGAARVLLRWAEVLVGSGDRRRRASSARGPSPTSFGVLGLTRARQSFLWPDKSGWRGGGEAIEDVLSECAPHPAHAPYLTHACARATQVPASCNHRCSTGGALRRRESSRERRGGDGAAPRAAAAARLGERTWATAATCMAHCLACSGETHRHDRAGPARHEGPVLPSRDVNRTQLRAGLQTTSSPVDLPLSLPQSPLSLFT